MTDLPAGSASERIVVDRPPKVVYDFYADFANIPRIVGDVTQVRDLGDGSYRWTVELPLGLRTSMHIVVEQRVPHRLLRYRTSGPTALRARWQLEFLPTPDGRTEVRETLSGPLGPPFSFLLALLGKHPRAEVRANLKRLKGVLEASGPPGRRTPAG